MSRAPSLFPDLCGTGETPVPVTCHLSPSSGAAGVSPVPRKRGRGATPQRVRVINFQRPNPAGQRKLTFAYRPLHHWQEWTQLDGRIASVSGRLALVEDLLSVYFQAVGGFRRATDCIVRIWYEALDSYSREDLALAIDAKAASLRADDPAERAFKRCFTGRPETFIQRIDYWLEQSPSYTSQRERERLAAADERLRHRLDSLRVSAPAVPVTCHLSPSLGGTGVPPVPLNPSIPQSLNPCETLVTLDDSGEVSIRDNSPQCALLRQAEAARARQRLHELAWRLLLDRERRLATRAVAGDWDRYVRSSGLDPHDPRLDSLWLDWRITAAIKLWPARVLDLLESLDDRSQAPPPDRRRAEMEG